VTSLRLALGGSHRPTSPQRGRHRCESSLFLGARKRGAPDGNSGL